jgi:hypothetical protein
MNALKTVALAVVIVAAGGCAGQKGPAATSSAAAIASWPVQHVSSSSPSAIRPSPDSSARPVDPTITPVSRASPSPEAEAAIEACGADRAGLDHVVGMGRIPSARDTAVYADLVGVEPEIQSDRPAWMIQFAGRIDLGRGYWADDPVCVVIDGLPKMFAPHAAGRGDVTSVTVELPTHATLALPPLGT